MSAEGFLTAQEFARAHGDIVSVMVIGGIPWPESLADAPFSPDVQQNLGYHPPSGKKLFLSISPLNKDRKDRAPYWGEKDNLPLPKPWDSYTLDSPEVKKAYLNFVLRAVAAMHPNYLAIGIESNVLLSNDARKWKQLKALHIATYTAVKAQYPGLPVCFTTEVLHYKKLHAQARGSDQFGEVAALMRHSDLFATTDFEKLCEKLPPPVDDLARIWAYTGMQTSERKPKPALAIWDAYLRAKYQR